MLDEQKRKEGKRKERGKQLKGSGVERGVPGGWGQ
jgi:hypothetical protein